MMHVVHHKVEVATLNVALGVHHMHVVVPSEVALEVYMLVLGKFVVALVEVLVELDLALVVEPMFPYDLKLVEHVVA